MSKVIFHLNQVNCNNLQNVMYIIRYYCKADIMQIFKSEVVYKVLCLCRSNYHMKIFISVLVLKTNVQGRIFVILLNSLIQRKLNPCLNF